MIIAVWGVKGGVGTTTIALGLAKSVSANAYLLVDGDMNCPTLSSLTGTAGTGSSIDWVFMSETQDEIESNLRKNVISTNGIVLLPGVKYPPGDSDSAVENMRSLIVLLRQKGIHTIVDVGSGIASRIQNEILKQADVVVVVTTPYLPAYASLWNMAKNALFIPYGLLDHCLLVVNRFFGIVSAKEIADLMGLPLAATLPEIRNATEWASAGQLENLFNKKARSVLSNLLEAANALLQKPPGELSESAARQDPKRKTTSKRLFFREGIAKNSSSDKELVLFDDHRGE